LRIGFIVFVTATDLRSKQVAFYTSQRLPKETASADRGFKFQKTQSAFHPHAQRNAFRRRDVHLQVRSLARENRRLRTGEFSGEIDRLVAPQRTVNAGEVVEIFSDMVKSSF
jgi:hypothetical protein